VEELLDELKSADERSDDAVRNTILRRQLREVKRQLDELRDTAVRNTLLRRELREAQRRLAEAEKQLQKERKRLAEAERQLQEARTRNELLMKSINRCSGSGGNQSGAIVSH